MLYIDILDNNHVGLEIKNNKVLFRASTLVGLLQCPYKLHFMFNNTKSKDFSKNISLIKGSIFHYLINYLITESEYTSYEIAVNNIKLVAEKKLKQYKERYTENIEDVDIDAIIILAKSVYEFLSKNCKNMMTEKTIIIDKGVYALKITPDLICDIGIIDFKTTKKPITDANFEISYDYALQMAIYSYFLETKASLLYCSLSTNTFVLKQPGEFKNLEQRVENLARSILNSNNFLNCKTQFKHICNNCFYRRDCEKSS